MSSSQRILCLVALVPLGPLVSAQSAASVPQNANAAQIKQPYDEVDLFIGTANDGNTFPGASLPFGMIQWSPDTGPDAWYNYGKKSIYGFSLTHISGAGCPLYGDFPVLPWPGDLTVSPHANREIYTQPFEHTHEFAHPGYYAVTLANGIRVEITVTERAGIAHFTFPDGTPARLLLNAGGSANSTVVDKKPDDPARANDGYSITVNGDYGVSGQARAGNFCGSATRYALYMSAQFDHPFVRTQMWHDDTIDPAAKKEDARHAGAWLDFGDQREVTMRVGISFVSVKNAQANAKFEYVDREFDAIRNNAKQAWSVYLNSVDITGGTSEQRTIFYTGLYHTLLSPNLFNDTLGDYTGFDSKLHKTEFLGPRCAGLCIGAQYANFSDWDIYRDVIQLHALLDPTLGSDEAQSLVNDAQQSGWLPRWPAANDVTYVMGGDSPAVLLADAYAFGAKDFDVKSGLQFMLKAANQPGTGPHGDSERPFLADELKLGYVPVDKDRIAGSRTLEYASDDFAIAQFARALGDTASADALTKRAGNWQNLLDPDSKWIRPRNADGSWQSGFDALHSQPRESGAPQWVGPIGFEEGNSPQYSFMIPFDYARLIPAMGGDSVMIPRLDSFFSKLICWGEPCFNMANEPDFVVPYTYAYTSQPWKTDDVVTRIEQQTFSTRPDGVPGNDDLGATSGVYVWNALGLYPGVPGVGGFFLGTPMFSKATVHFGNGRTLVIERSGSGPYVTAISLNGQPWNNLWLPLDKIPTNAKTTLHFTTQEAAPTSTILKPPPTFIR
jgi:predicted alpha-1,2-mannosidase